MPREIRGIQPDPRGPIRRLEGQGFSEPQIYAILNMQALILPRTPEQIKKTRAEQAVRLRKEGYTPEGIKVYLDRYHPLPPDADTTKKSP